MHASDVVRAYIAFRNETNDLGKELAPKTCEHYFDCVQVFSRYLERPATVADFNAATVMAFLKSLLANKNSPYTVRNRRTGICVLWRFAHAQGWCGPCVGVRNVHLPELRVNGYSFAQMSTLLASVALLRGVVRNTGIPKPVYWDSFLRTDWEVGLRIGDMLRIETQHFEKDGWLWCAESKTRKVGWRRLRQSTADSIRASIAANPHRKFIWPGYTRKNICRAFSDLAKAAGVNGTSKFIRSGSSSEVDRLYPGTGWRHLRHSTPVVWEKHYKVSRITEQGRPMPPELPV